MKSKSIQALERLYSNLLYGVDGFESDAEELEGLEAIKKDLERLELIENLRTTPNALETCLANYMNKCIELEKEYSNLQNDYDDKDFECIDLLKENQELKTENYKLKKAIEILKDGLDLEVDIDSRTIITDVGDTSIVGATKDDIKDLLLLKEVLD